MRSRLHVVSSRQSVRVSELFEALEAETAGLGLPELLNAIGQGARLRAVLDMRRVALSTPPASAAQPDLPRYLDLDTAAGYLTISTTTVKRLIERGKLQPCRLSEGVVRFDRRDLDAYAERSKNTP